MIQTKTFYRLKMNAAFHFYRFILCYARQHVPCQCLTYQFFISHFLFLLVLLFFLQIYNKTCNEFFDFYTCETQSVEAIQRVYFLDCFGCASQRRRKTLFVLCANLCVLCANLCVLCGKKLKTIYNLKKYNILFLNCVFE